MEQSAVRDVALVARSASCWNREHRWCWSSGMLLGVGAEGVSCWSNVLSVLEQRALTLLGVKAVGPRCSFCVNADSAHQCWSSNRRWLSICFGTVSSVKAVGGGGGGVVSVMEQRLPSSVIRLCWNRECCWRRSSGRLWCWERRVLSVLERRVQHLAVSVRAVSDGAVRDGAVAVGAVFWCQTINQLCVGVGAVALELSE
jgi:hypothetical protein